MSMGRRFHARGAVSHPLDADDFGTCIGGSGRIIPGGVRDGMPPGIALQCILVNVHSFDIISTHRLL